MLVQKVAAVAAATTVITVTAATAAVLSGAVTGAADAATPAATSVTETVVVPADTTGFDVPRLACPVGYPYLLNRDYSALPTVVRGIQVQPPEGVSVSLRHTVLMPMNKFGGPYAGGLESATSDGRNAIDNATDAEQSVRITAYCTNSLGAAVPYVLA